ncbi:amidase signature domain-containing protein [Nemania sp. NC0429]|nr:amidase signature domain-containing protein [Nemania sp. NC0429]
MKVNSIVQLAQDLVYHVKQPAALRLHGPPEHYAESPVEPSVLINFPEKCADYATFLKDRLYAFVSADDVYDPAFATQGTFIFQHTSDITGAKNSVESAVEQLCSHKNVLYHFAQDGQILPEGPYFLMGSFVHQAWRLYPDVLRAFTVATIPSFNLGDKGRYDHEPIMATSVHGDELAVAVPSRLYTPSTVDLPLNGKRISIKDSVHLAGIKTSMGNRAYIDYYGPQAETAEYVKFLIDKGAIIIGKTKMNSFAGSEKPSNQVIDYFPPWNPRGDGYQRPAGSSTGAGVSTGGYTWCDFAVGTDSMLTLSPTLDFDSWALFTRGLDDLYKFADVSTGGKLSAKLPTKILYPIDWLPYKIPEQQKMNEEFLAAMESVLGVKHKKVCLANMWKESPPAAAGGKSISEFLENTGFWPMYYDNYHAFDDFREGYQKSFGKPVYVSPPQRWKWDLGSKITPEQRAQGLSERETFMQWIEQYVLTRDSDGNGEAVILLPLGNAQLEYRDVDSGPPGVVKSFEPKYFGSVLGLPQIVTPIGQLVFESRISQRMENVPIITTIAGAQGSDLMLVKVMQLAVAHAGWPESVQTGRNCFLEGEKLAGGQSRTPKLS